MDMGILGKVLKKRNPSISISTKIDPVEWEEDAELFLGGMLGDDQGLRGDHRALGQPFQGPIGQPLAVRGVEEDDPESVSPAFKNPEANEHVQGKDFGLLGEPAGGDIPA